MRLLVGCAVVAAVSLAALANPLANQGQTKDDLAAFRAVTAEQKVLASIFDEPVSPPLRPNQTRIENVEQIAPPHDPPEYSAFVKDAVCSSDFVVVGRAISSRPFLTQTDSSIVTSYSVAVEEFLRGSIVHRQPTSDTTLQVVLRGGTIQTATGPIEVQNEEPMTVTGRYLMFLKQIPNTSSYKLSGPHFSLADEALRPRGRRELPTELAQGRKGSSAVRADLRAAGAKCGKAVSNEKDRCFYCVHCGPDRSPTPRTS